MLFKKVSVFLISIILFFSFFSFGFSSVGQCADGWVEVITQTSQIINTANTS